MHKISKSQLELWAKRHGEYYKVLGLCEPSDAEKLEQLEYDNTQTQDTPPPFLRRHFKTKVDFSGVTVTQTEKPPACLGVARGGALLYEVLSRGGTCSGSQERGF